MKKLILLIAFAALASGAAWGQSFYTESYTEYSKTLNQKYWFSNGYARGESFDAKGAMSRMIIIYRPDSAKIYQIFPDKKAYMTMAMTPSNTMLTDMMNDAAGIKVEKGRTRTRNFIKNENVEGFPCARYDWKNVITRADDSTEELTGTDWVYEPLNIVIKSTNMRAYPSNECVVVRLIREGPQPAHLFKIPEGYKQIPVAGQLGKMLKSSLSTPEADKVKKDIKDTEKAMKAIKDNPNKSQNEKTMDMLKLLNEMQKKK